MNNPDNWVVIFMDGPEPHYRILAGWSGGYTTGDSWQMNSGIVKVEEDEENENYYLFHGNSGSIYRCHKEAYCLRMNNAHIWKKLQKLHGDKVQMMDEKTNWLKQDWIIGKDVY